MRPLGWQAGNGRIGRRSYGVRQHGHGHANQSTVRYSHPEAHPIVRIDFDIILHGLPGVALQEVAGPLQMCVHNGYGANREDARASFAS